MKALSVVAILILLASTAWFGVKNAEMQRELETVRDTLGSLRIQQQIPSIYNIGLQKIGELNFDISDTVLEMHRIVGNDSRQCFLLRIEVGLDSSVHAVFKKFTLEHPLTKEGKDSVFLTTTPKINFADFQQFKAKLSQLEFTKAVVDDTNILCCFGGGTLSWEAVEKTGTRYRFSTFCRQSEQFAEACEFLLRHVGDDYLKQKF